MSISLYKNYEIHSSVHGFYIINLSHTHYLLKSKEVVSADRYTPEEKFLRYHHESSDAEKLIDSVSTVFDLKDVKDA